MGAGSVENAIFNSTAASQSDPVQLRLVGVQFLLLTFVEAGALEEVFLSLIQDLDFHGSLARMFASAISQSMNWDVLSATCR